MNIFITFGLLIRLVIAVQGELDLTHLKKPSVSAAITNSRVFNFMFGKGLKFKHFESDPFELPAQILFSECQIRNERHFIEFLLRNDWMQRRLGIKMNGSNGFFPDIKGEIYDGTGDLIKVEVEYRAENYIAHGHAFRGCDLILSFVKSPDIVFIKGIPVWSFYEAYKNDRWGLFCLNSDMRYDFSNHIDVDELTPLEKRLYNLGGDYLKNYRDYKIF